MDPISIFIVFSGGLTLGSGFIIFLRNKKDQSSILFLIMTFLIALWTVCSAVNRVTNPDPIQLLVGRLTYVCGFSMVYFFWIFSLYYPFPQKKNNQFFITFGPIYFVFLIYILYFGDYFVKETVIKEGVFVLDKYVNSQYYLFMLLIVLYTSMALKNLIKKTHELQGIHSHNLKVMTISLLSSTMIILISDLIMPLFGNFSLIWIGPLSLLPIVVGTAYILSSK